MSQNAPLRQNPPECTERIFFISRQALEASSKSGFHYGGSVSGRTYISEDPIGWASGQTNNYAYVGGDPVSFRDPSGLCGMPSFDEWWSEAKDDWNTTNREIDSWFPDIPFTSKDAPLVGSPAKLAGLAGGGAAAASFGGQTLLQAARDAYAPKSVKYPFGPAITPMKTPIYWPRVAATSLVTGLATSAAWGIGVAIGSGVSPFARRALDMSCY